MTCEQADRARNREIANLVRRGTWELVLKKDIQLGSNIASGSFVIAIKDLKTGKLIFKARFAAHRHRDAEEHYPIHDSTNVRQSSVRLLITLVAIIEFHVLTEDIPLAYLQSAIKLLCEVYLGLKRISELLLNMY